jgi:hypothetical protein
VNPAERASALVLSWAGMYTRRLPYPVAHARRAELASDLWEQRADGHGSGTPPAWVGLAILLRMAAGVPADLSWRHRQLAAAQGRPLRTAGQGAIVTQQQPGSLTALRQRLRTRRCRSCGERYPRRLPYCPVCKVRPGHDGIDRGADRPWAQPGFGP